MLKQYYYQKLIEAGCDEAGRGCLAGPVFAAAVILPKSFSHQLLNDSKQMSEKNRKTLEMIIKKEAISWAVQKLDNSKIDELNILRASILCMHLAIENLKTTPEMLLIDGNRFYKYQNIRHQCIVKGDSIYMAIAAASVLAKTHRDAYMVKMHEKYPKYDLVNNKGYPTKKHRLAIREYGPCDIHRKSFKLLSGQLTIFD